MTNEERLKAAGWRVCSVPGFKSWTRDRISWHTESEALVVVLTAERDAAIARAEAAEALAASIVPDDAAVFVASNGASCAATRRVFAALRAHAAKVSR